jgi:hypothetical protein
VMKHPLAVHALSLLSIGGQCRGHWDSNAGVVVGKATVRSESFSQNGTVQEHEDAHTQTVMDDACEVGVARYAGSIPQ